MALRDYIYGNYIDEVLLMVADPDGTPADYYLGHDHLFSPVVLFAAAGTIFERYEYDAYGAQTIFEPDFSSTRSSSTYDNPIAFTGQRLDSLDGNTFFIMYYKNRYYLVTLGRFLSRDPIGLDGGFSRVDFSPLGACSKIKRIAACKGRTMRTKSGETSCEGGWTSYKR